MSREVVAAFQGQLSVDASRALRLAWGLASGCRPWLDAAHPLELPELPRDVDSLVDIPYAVTLLGSDGRYDLNGPDDEGQRHCEGRDHWRPCVYTSSRGIVWKPLELGAQGFAEAGRTPGHRQIQVEEDAGRWWVKWSSGGHRESRFIGRAILAVRGTLDTARTGCLWWRPCEPDSWWALPDEVRS